MKKFTFLMLFMCLMAGLFLLAPQGKAAEHNDHCICGGSVDAGDHVTCKNVTWEAVRVSNNKVTVADGGYYYLSDNTAASLTVDSKIEVTICLNGYRLQAQCPIMVYGGGVVNICDCQGTGVIRATNPNNAKGTVMLISSSAAYVGTVNMYSGTIDGVAGSAGLVCRAVEVKGGIFNMYGGQIKNGLSDGSITSDSRPGHGGNVYVYNNAGKIGCFTMYDGIVTGGRASENGGNIYALDGQVTVSGGHVTDGDMYLGTTSAARLTASAVEKCQIYSGCKEMYLDMNGCDLSGLTVDGTVYAYDSKTDEYLGDYAGRLTYTANCGTVVALNQPGKRYLAVNEENGVSFHRYYVAITSLVLKPGRAGMGYKATFCGDDAVKGLMNRNKAYGYKLWLEGHAPITCGFGAEKFGGNETVTLGLDNILSSKNDNAVNSANADVKIYACAYIQLSDGQVLQSTTQAYNLKELIHLVDNQYAGYSESQKKALQAIGSKFSQVMMSWDVENFHHASGGMWTPVDEDAFLSLMKQGTSKYTIPSGNYVLTENVDIGQRQIYLHNDVTICLNGHTITGSKQLFDMRGNLTICDCRETDAEGGLISTYNTGEKIFAPVVHVRAGVMNLYGGNLQAGGNIRSAGVVGVGDYNTNPTTTGLFNMYGGSIFGGVARYNGGLVTVWNGSAFNMYGGSIHDGSCIGEENDSNSGNGGGLVVRDGSIANLYGGEIYGCTAANNGGGVWVQSDARCYIGNVKIYNNSAGGKGGNVFGNNTRELILQNTIVTGGVATEGGGVYQHAGEVTVTGTTVIRDNKNGDLQLHTNATLQADGLAAGADVQVSAAIHGKIGNDPAAADYVTCTDDGYTVMQYGSDMVLWNGTLTKYQNITDLSAGLGRVCITPRDENGNLLPVPLDGYGSTEYRLAQSVDGELYVTVTAITDQSGQTVLLLTVDLSGMSQDTLKPYISHISYMTGVPVGNIIVTCSHTHSAPAITSSMDVITEYRQKLPDLFAQAAIAAMNDRQEAAMYTGSFEVTGGKDGKGLNFTRHYRYQDADGNWQYSCDNFGERDLNSQINPQHVTEADPTMHLVKFERAGRDILMVNWRAHPTMTGSPNETVLSSDYVGALRDALEAETDMSMIFFQGAAGNVNATSRLDAEEHDLTFREYGKALSGQIAEAIGAGILTAQQPGLWQVDHYTYTAMVDHTDDDRYEEASTFVKEYYEQFPGNQASQSVRLAWCAARGWTCVFEASAIVNRAQMGKIKEIPLNTLALGNTLALYTAPGELFDTVSVELEEDSPFRMTFCIGYSMDTQKYFAYDPNNGGAMTYESYEGFNHNFVAPTTILDMISYWKTTLKRLYESAQ